MSYNLNIEKLKKDKTESNIIADIFYYAVFGEKISHEDLERFKWYGIYSQDENQGLFTIKVPLNLGELNLKQLEAVSLITKEYTSDNISLSNKQQLEFKDVKIFNIPSIFNLLKDANLSSFFESGHNIRRVLTCPVNGIDKTQLYDVEDLALKLNNIFVGNKNFSNLPNALQIAISGYEEGCDVGFLPHISFNATKDSKGKVVFSINILDTNIGYINPSQIVNTTRAIANIYKDFGSRDDYFKSSFEGFIQDISLSSFFDILSSMIDFRIQNSCFINPNKTPKKPRLGINDSSIKDFSYVGCKVENINLNSKKIDKLIDILELTNASRVKITHKANLIVLDVPTKNANNLALELKNIGFNAFI